MHCTLLYIAHALAHHKSLCEIAKKLLTFPSSVTLLSMTLHATGTALLITAEAVATTAVVCVVCNFTAGLILGVLLTQFHGHCQEDSTCLM